MSLAISISLPLYLSISLSGKNISQTNIGQINIYIIFGYICITCVFPLLDSILSSLLHFYKHKLLALLYVFY